jgi:hypothetical protein
MRSHYPPTNGFYRSNTMKDYTTEFPDTYNQYGSLRASTVGGYNPAMNRTNNYGNLSARETFGHSA